jgi:hypothetical protein
MTLHVSFCVMVVCLVVDQYRHLFGFAGAWHCRIQRRHVPAGWQPVFLRLPLCIDSDGKQKMGGRRTGRGIALHGRLDVDDIKLSALPVSLGIEQSVRISEGFQSVLAKHARAKNMLIIVWGAGYSVAASIHSRSSKRPHRAMRF